jgi:hypothetical protein
LDVPSSDFIATQDFDVASSRKDLDIQMKNEVVVKPSTLAESALKRLRRSEGMDTSIFLVNLRCQLRLRDGNGLWI